MMMSATSGRVAVITGSNKGVGYFIALQLGLSGLFQHIILACRNESLAQAAVESLKAQFPEKVQVSAEPLTLGDTDSHQKLADRLASRFDSKIDVLVNNAAMAYKNADPTPFREQCKPSLDVNFRGTVDLTERLLPLLRRGSDPRIVNVASMTGRLSQLTQERQAQFSSPELTMSRLQELMHEFQASVLDGTHSEKGWGNSNYGTSKLAVVAATKVWARQEAPAGIKVNCCCPGYCKTDMTSQKGLRDPADGAKNAVLPATMENPPTGEIFQDYKVSEW
jgi:carbonyl reductase 1